MRQRVVDLRWVAARDLRANPHNYRVHPARQVMAIRQALATIGMADVILAYEDEGQLTIIDGHMRAGLLQNETVPVVVLDVTAQEADELMTLLDPIAAMAKINKEKAEQLRARVRPEIQRAMENIPAWEELRAAKKKIIEEAKDRPRFRRMVTCPACGEKFEL